MEQWAEQWAEQWRSGERARRGSTVGGLAGTISGMLGTVASGLGTPLSGIAPGSGSPNPAGATLDPDHDDPPPRRPGQLGCDDDPPPRWRGQLGCDDDPPLGGVVNSLTAPVPHLLGGP